MISEVIFARDYTSFWRAATPFMDGYLRRVNKGGYDRDYRPMTAGTAPNRRAFVNEIAFETLCIAVEKMKTGEAMQLDLALQNSISVVHQRFIQLKLEGDFHNTLSSDERADASEQVRRLMQRIGGATKVPAIICKPPFRGCGIIDGCCGDIIVNSTLYEIKAGDRLFRSIDIRQIILYLALNASAGCHRIHTVGLINPRVGISLELSVEELCYEVSGRNVGTLLDAIIYGMSSGEVSR